MFNDWSLLQKALALPVAGLLVLVPIAVVQALVNYHLEKRAQNNQAQEEGEPSEGSPTVE